MNDPIIYFIEIPEEVSGVKEFTGYKFSVDFYKGRGSTSSAHDAKLAQERGCIVRDREDKQLFIQRTFNEGRREVFTASEVPVEDVPKPVEPTPRFVNKADRQMQEALERKHAR